MNRKEELQKKRLIIEEELADIREAERKVQEELDKEKLINFMDSIDVILKFVDHSRTSCSDEDVGNAYTTSGRGGAFRCNRCALLVAADTWKKDGEWLKYSTYDCIAANLDIRTVELDVTVLTDEV